MAAIIAAPFTLIESKKMPNPTLPKTDPHAERAAEFFKIPISEVTPEQRKIGKMQNYHDWYNLPKPPVFNQMNKDKT